VNSKRKQITLRLKKELSEKLEKNAQDLGVSTNAYISMVLAKEIETKKTK